MIFTVDFSERDFSIPILLGLKADPVLLSWSVYGGPDQAQIRLIGSSEKLLNASRLIRCPVTVADSFGSPVWWGYVQEINIFLEMVQINISLEKLFNSVAVQYSFISPDNHLADQTITSTADDTASQTEYGVKEKLLHAFNIDDDFALSLRDNFLNFSSRPFSQLSQSRMKKACHVMLKCSGWFKTLSWKTYQNTEGFYANYGPGPGSFNFGQSSSYRFPSQRFTPGASGDLKYAYFQLRQVGGCTRNLNAQLRNASGALLATSNAVSGSTLSSIYYTWVKFTFLTPYALLGASTYLIGVTSNGTNATQYFSIRTDENQTFTAGYAQYYNGGSWVNLPSITNPGGAPDLIFRAICVLDTGAQLSDIASAGNQFFSRIITPTTNTAASPFRVNGYDCLKEIRALMDLGTSNHRRILAEVSAGRALRFYEQPDPDQPSVYIDQQGQFLTFQGKLLMPYFPPVGQFARYSGSDRILLPFDKDRIPVCFIERAVFWPQTGQVWVKSHPW